MRRGLLTLAVAWLLMGADRSGCGAPPQPTDTLELCPPPTVEQCTTPQTTCDTSFANQAKTDVNAACSLLLYQAAKAEAGRFPRKLARNTTLFSTDDVV